jgi:hypothetical protein
LSRTDLAPSTKISQPLDANNGHMAGIADFVLLLGTCQDDGLSVFFFGSEASVIYALRDKASEDFPDLIIAGICDAAFDGPASREIIDHIAGARPGLVVTDMAGEAFLRFWQSHAERFAPVRLINLPGSFRCFVLPTTAKPWALQAPAPIARRLGDYLQGVLSVATFAAIVLVQFLRGLAPMLWLSRAGATPRREK